MSYEGKGIDSARNVSLSGSVNPPVPNAGLAASFHPTPGDRTTLSFKENLAIRQDRRRPRATTSASSSRAASGATRIAIPEDFTKSAPGNDQHRINEETRLDLKHEWTTDKLFLNEARIGYERYRMEPERRQQGARKPSISSHPPT